MESRRIAAMLSGGGRTLRNLHEAIDRGELDAEVRLVVASRECPGADWAREAGYDVVVERGLVSESRLLELVEEANASWVVLAGYLRLLPIPEALRGRVVNIHPALLPSFGGAGMHGLRGHRAVLDHGCKVTGATVHMCDDRYDTGPILSQEACRVWDGDTPETLAERVFEVECRLYPETLGVLIGGGYSIQGRRARKIVR